MESATNYTGQEKVFFNMAYKFAIAAGKTETEADAAGHKEVESFRKKRKIHSQPQKWVDLSTGKTHKANY